MPSLTASGMSLPAFSMNEGEFVNTISSFPFLFLLDLSWLSYRGHFAHRGLSVPRRGVNVPSGHVYSPLNVVMQIKRKYPRCHILLVRDGSQPRRKSTPSGYKSTRSSLPFDIHIDMAETALMACRIPGVYFAYDTFLEADDLLYSIAKYVERELSQSRCVIYTGDKDLLQSVSERVFWIKAFEGRSRHSQDYHGPPEVQSMFGVPVERLTLLRSIQGDPSDDLPGVPKLPRTWSAHHVSTMPSADVDSIFARPLTFGGYPNTLKTCNKYFAHLSEFRPRVEENFGFMELSEHPFTVERPVDSPSLRHLTKSWEMFALDRFVESLEE